MNLIDHSMNRVLIMLFLSVWWQLSEASPILPSHPTIALPDSTFACNELVHVSVNENCEAFIQPDDIVEGYNGDFNDFSVSLKDENGFPVPNPVNGDYLGSTIIVTATHLPTGLSCWGQALIEDKWAPQLFCSNDTVLCTQNLNLAFFPTASDNCDTNVTIHLNGQFIDQSDPCNGVVVTRTFSAHDDYGNYAVPCVQVLTVLAPPLPDFPEDTIWTCEIFALYPNVVEATPLTDSLPTTGSGVPDVALGIYCPYSVANTDLVVEGCAETFSIVRTWVVLNWCTGQIITTDINGDDNLQVIKVMDAIPPVITLESFTVSANMAGNHPGECLAIGYLPPANVSDNCSGWTLRILTPVGEAIYLNGQDGENGGFIPPPGLPLGDHTIIYEAHDECSNYDTLEVTVTVADLTAPVAVCDEITSVSLNNLGFADLFAESLDDGSYDYCCLDSFLVRRMESPCNPDDLVFGPTVEFCCEDVGQFVTVVFRAMDCFGNYNDCMVLVEVEDKLGPTLGNCPPPVTIDCIFYTDSLEISLTQGDFSVLDQFGSPVFLDNCELIYLVDTVFQNISQCQEGTLIRSWQVTDPGNNNTLSCNQTIFVQHISDWVVEFPADITVTCTQSLPPTGEPEIFFDDCELIAVSFEDEIFTVVPDACYKIVRTWTVINWCVVGPNIDQEVIESPESVLNFDLNGDGEKNNRTFQDGLNAGNFNAPAPMHGAQPDGYIIYQQTIKVIDNTKPVLTCEPEIEICILEGDCDVTFELPAPEVQDCSQEITITTNGPLGTGLGPFLDVPPGIYPTTYVVSDNCGNTSACNTIVTVKDCKDPTPYCINGLVIALGQDTIVTIPADQFDAGSFDNCPGDLIFSFSSDTTVTTMDFDCFSLGYVYVEIWVTDASGNQDLCETFVFVDDNIGVCQGPPLIAGEIKTGDDQPVNGVQVGLNGTSQSMGFTADDGYFSFEVPNGGDYTLTPAKDTLPLNGVTTFDLVLISKHILGTQLLDSPYKIIAADANKSNSITTSDIVAIRKLILHLSNSFPNNSSWRFIQKDFVFPDLANPFISPFPEILNLNNLSGDVLNGNFVGIKTGDVNWSADPQN